MARLREFDDESVVRAARDVFWERGYTATSLAQLQTATGLSKSSLYETYGSKRGLFDRAVQSYLDEIIAPLLGPLEVDGAGETALVTYFSSLARFFRAGPERIARRGCLLLNTAMELNDLDAAAAEVVTGYRTRVHQAFLAAATAMSPTTANPSPADAVRSSTADPDRRGDAHRRADVLTAAQIGLMITSRLDPLQAAALADNLAAEVRTW